MFAKYSPPPLFPKALLALLVVEVFAPENLRPPSEAKGETDRRRRASSCHSLACSFSPLSLPNEILMILGAKKENFQLQVVIEKCKRCFLQEEVILHTTLSSHLFVGGSANERRTVFKGGKKNVTSNLTKGKNSSK